MFVRFSVHLNKEMRSCGVFKRHSWNAFSIFFNTTLQSIINKIYFFCLFVINLFTFLFSLWNNLLKMTKNVKLNNSNSKNWTDFIIFPVVWRVFTYVYSEKGFFVCHFPLALSGYHLSLQNLTLWGIYSLSLHKISFFVNLFVGRL